MGFAENQCIYFVLKIVNTGSIYTETRLRPSIQYNMTGYTEIKDNIKIFSVWKSCNFLKPSSVFTVAQKTAETYNAIWYKIWFSGQIPSLRAASFIAIPWGPRQRSLNALPPFK